MTNNRTDESGMTRTSEQPKKPIKPRLCSICRQEYRPWRSIQPTCGDRACEHAYAMRTVEKAARKRNSAEKLQKQAERAAIKARKEKIKTLAQLAKDAEHWINRIARIRDRNEPCISCDRPASWDGQWHASHYKSVGANSALRFNLINIHKACSICNNHLSGNIAEYARRLPDRIGMERFRFIESHPRERKYSREYLIRLKAVAMRWCKRLERRANSEMQN